MFNRPRPPQSEARRQSFSEQLAEVYGGPTDFMEAGVRGFLVTTLPEKEEFAVDDAMDLLRQTAIKLYGGYKPSITNSKQLERKGYVKVNWLNLDKVVVLPNPGGEEEEFSEKREDESGTEKATNEEEGQKTQADADKGEQRDEESEEKGEAEKMETEDTQKPCDDKEAEEKKDGEEGTAGVEKKGDEDQEETDEQKKEVKEEKSEKEEEEQKEKKKAEEEKRKDAAVPRMHSTYKFNAYRTEMRNVMFIKSDVPDPMELAQGAMELVYERKKITGDAVCQLLPVLGVCHFDYQQLEIMCRRCLAPVFDESSEPKSFGLMLVDKLSEPGAEVVYEVVRNTIWSVNPLAWMSSPIAEPDVVLRFELIGSKLVLSCLTHYMSYRQYSPTLLVDMGKGEPEEDDGGWMSEEAKRQLEEKRKEREREREQEKLRELERQKERAKRQEEAEARRKAREDERKKREEVKKEKREKERKEREEKKKKEKSEGKTSGNKSEKDADTTESSKKDEKSEEHSSDDKQDVEEGTPPSKKQKTDSEGDTSKDEGKEEMDELEASMTEETPPPKRQRVDSSVDEISKEEEEMLLADDSKEGEVKADDEQEESEEKTTPSPKRATRGTRSTKKRTSKK